MLHWWPCQAKTAASEGRYHTQTDDSFVSESKNSRFCNYASKFLRLNADYLAFVNTFVGSLVLRSLLAHGYLSTIRQLDEGRLWVPALSRIWRVVMEYKFNTQIRTMDWLSAHCCTDSPISGTLFRLAIFIPFKSISPNTLTNFHSHRSFQHLEVAMWHTGIEVKFMIAHIADPISPMFFQFDLHVHSRGLASFLL